MRGSARIIRQPSDAERWIPEGRVCGALARKRRVVRLLIAVSLSVSSLAPQEELEAGIDAVPVVSDPTGTWINILAVFLMSVNYYITVPTTNSYADELGLSAAYSGVIIGMSPLAQTFSAFVYSWWSNHAFKTPIIVSSTLQLIGAAGGPRIRELCCLGP
jgi:cyanate permease